MFAIEHEVEEVELEALPWWKRTLGKLFQYPRWQVVGMDYVVEIEYSVSPFISAMTSGPPEDCYPAEGGELDEFKVTLLETDFYDEDGNSLNHVLSDEEEGCIERDIEQEIESGGHLYDELIEFAAENDEYEPFPEYEP